MSYYNNITCEAFIFNKYMAQTNKQSIKKAGAIIFSNDNFDRVVLLYRSKQRDWSFPKGHIDGAESPFNAMEREIKEETGLAGKVISMLPNLEYENAKKEKVVVFMYLLTAQKSDVFHLENPNDKVEWIDKNKVVNVLTHSNLKEYFIANLPFIEKKLKDFSKT